MPGKSVQIDSGSFLLPWSENSGRSKRRGEKQEKRERLAVKRAKGCAEQRRQRRPTEQERKGRMKDS